MRTTGLFPLSLALLPYWCPCATATPPGALDIRSHTPFETVVELTIAIHGNTIDGSLAAPPYVTDCTKFPNVCENWCYYVFCHKLGVDKNSAFWTVTVNRTAAMRGKSECGRISPNKCSVKQGMWPPNPVANQDCDEQPKNTNDEGGVNAATRCMDRSENRGEGSTWGNFIDNGGPGRIADGTKVMVQLSGPSGPLCASYRMANTTVCPLPAQPSDPDAATNAIRQQ